MQVRTRFAPSPTGFVHLGNIRTALYAYLYARHNNGKFILRIEDTDLERSTQAAVDIILDSMQWLGLDYDEGPFYQTKRFARYNEIIDQLLATKHAYKCYCSKERIDELRKNQLENKEKPRYDGRCRELDKSYTGDYVIRFKNPLIGSVKFVDCVKGEIEFQNNELDDLIIARSDGTPTYNLSVVVDDIDMQITHVIRGDDHVNNTPRQINIFLALNKIPPSYAHTPMILGADKKLLSKRSGAASAIEYRENGILPQALLNYLVRLGWSHGDQEIFSLDEMIKYFDLSHLNNAPASFSLDKLLWLNQYYMQNLSPDHIASELVKIFVKENINVNNGPNLKDLLLVQAPRCKTLKEIVDTSCYFYQDDIKYSTDAIKKHFTADTAKVLQLFLAEFNKLAVWQESELRQIVQNVAAALQLKLGKVAQPLRIAITGDIISPSIDVTLKLLGKNKTILRLQKCIEMVKNSF